MRKIVSLIVVFFSISTLYAKGDLHLFDVNNKDKSITTKQIEKAFVDAGFGIGVNSNMNKPYMIQFKQTDYSIYTLLTVYDKKLSFELAKSHPEYGIFLPMSMAIYQSKKEDTLHLSVLTSQAQSKILGFNDKRLKTIEDKVLKAINKAMPKAKHTLSKEALKTKKPLVTKYVFDLDGEDSEESMENLLMSIDNGLEVYGFVVPSKLDAMPNLGKDSQYEFFQTYSICKLPVIYTVSKTTPEAGAFAPCSLAMYKKKSEDKIVIAFPNVYNWMSSARVQDKDAMKILLKTQKQFEAILAEAIE